MTNHPVHVQDEHGNLLPTALIPFCEFGGSMSVMGVKIDEFEIPFCNSFKEKLIKDKLCYTVDLNKRRFQVKDENDFTLKLFISYNEDRELDTFLDLDMSTTKGDDVIADQYVLVETIGKFQNIV